MSRIVKSIQFTGSNIVDVGNFLDMTSFEFNGDWECFIIHTYPNNVVLEKYGDLHYHADGTFSVENQPKVKTRGKKRGKKK